jgi:hypothetical protein
VAETHIDGGDLRWILVPIEKLGIRGFCETTRCHGRAVVATTFHAVIDAPGRSDQGWVACAECTGLMMQQADTRSA